MMKKFYMLLLSILFTFLFSTCNKDNSNPVQAPTMGTIQGVVTDLITGNVIVGAAVTTFPSRNFG